MNSRRTGMMTALLEVEDGRLLICSQAGDQYFLMDTDGRTEKLDLLSAVRIYNKHKGDNNENVIHSPVDDLDGDYSWRERLKNRLGKVKGSFLNNRTAEEQ